MMNGNLLCGEWSHNKWNSEGVGGENTTGMK